MSHGTVLPKLSQWTPPDGLDRLRPREMRLNWTGKVGVLAVVLLVLAGVVGAVAVQVGVLRRSAAGPPLFLPYLIAAASAVIGGAALLPLLRQRWLLAEGRAAPGVVTRYGKKDQHGTVYF